MTIFNRAKNATLMGDSPYTRLLNNCTTGYFKKMMETTALLSLGDFLSPAAPLPGLTRQSVALKNGCYRGKGYRNMVRGCKLIMQQGFLLQEIMDKFGVVLSIIQTRHGYVPTGKLIRDICPELICMDLCRKFDAWTGASYDAWACAGRGMHGLVPTAVGSRTNPPYINTLECSLVNNSAPIINRLQGMIIKMFEGMHGYVIMRLLQRVLL